MRVGFARKEFDSCETSVSQEPVGLMSPTGFTADPHMQRHSDPHGAQAESRAPAAWRAESFIVWDMLGPSSGNSWNH